MVEIEFDFNQVMTNIQAKLDDPFQDAINKLLEIQTSIYLLKLN